MPLTLLSINGTDLTQYIDVKSYNVNRIPVFEDWVDGNHINRRNVIRHRVTGEIKIGFRNNSDVESFLNLLSTNITSGNYYSASVFINNENMLYSGNVFIDGTAVIARDLLNGRVWHEYTIKIEER